MTHTNKVIAVMLLLLCPTIALTQDKTITKIQENITVIDKRLKNVEDYKSNLDQLYTINSKQLEKHVDEKVDEKVKDIDESKKTLNLLLYLGIPVTILGLLAVYFGAVKQARKLIVTKIETIVEHKREDFIKLIETQEFDTRLKNNRKLLVLSQNDNANENIKKIFDKLKFKNVIFRTISQYTEYSDADLIIFNDYDGSFEQNLIDAYITNTPDENVSFVAYTTRNLTRNPRINFSNSQYTLYHNVLSTLKYTEVLKLI